MTPEDRLDALEKAVRTLQEKLLHQQALTLFLSQCPGVLLALVAYLSDEFRQMRIPFSQALRDKYTELVRSEADKALAAIAADQPAYATALRTILQSQLGSLPAIEEDS